MYFNNLIMICHFQILHLLDSLWTDNVIDESYMKHLFYIIYRNFTKKIINYWRVTLDAQINSKLNLLEQFQNSSERFEIILCTLCFKTETGGTISKIVEPSQNFFEHAQNVFEMLGTDLRFSEPFWDFQNRPQKKAKNRLKMTLFRHVLEFCRGVSRLFRFFVFFDLVLDFSNRFQTFQKRSEHFHFWIGVVR